MKNNGRYEGLIKDLPWENAGRDMAPQIIAAAGIQKKQNWSTTRLRSWCRQFSPTIIGLVLAMFLLVFGWGCNRFEQLKGEQIGYNTIALWSQTAEGFRGILAK